MANRFTNGRPKPENLTCFLKPKLLYSFGRSYLLILYMSSDLSRLRIHGNVDLRDCLALKLLILAKVIILGI